MECKTQKGLYFIIIGSLISLIISIITSTSYLLIKSDVVQIIISILGLISFIGTIIILAGLITFYMGRKEFGEKHENNVKKALILVVVNIILAVIFAIAIVFMTFSAFMSSSSGNVETTGFSFVIIIFSLISSILGGLAYYFGLIDLEDETGKNVLFAGIISSILISAVTSFYIAGWLGNFLGDVSSTGNYSTLSLNQNIGGIGILGIIPGLLFLYAYYIAYNRIKQGEIKPKIDTSINPNISNRICPNCGRPIPFDAIMCPYCGKNFGQ